MQAEDKKIVLITGCSSGIGRALCVEFARLGHHVFASARKLATLDDLVGENITAIRLDVNDMESIENAVQKIGESAGRLDILINNAGYGLIGPTLELDLDEIREQFETNVFGPLAIIQCCLPLMINQDSAKIVNVGSISGIVATPFAGAYCASKAAIHLFSDCLRMELKPFGVDVIQLQPGGINSNFGEAAGKQLENSKDNISIYKDVIKSIESRTKMSQESSTQTDDFARINVKTILKNNPPTEFRYGHGAKLLPTLKRYLPTKMLDKILAKKFGLDGTLKN